MKNVIKLIVAVTITLLLAAVFSVVPTKSAHATTASSAAISHDVIVHHSKKGSGRISICKDWVSTDVSRYRCYTWRGTGQLWPGEDSLHKYGWKDTDAILVPSGYKLYIDVYGPDFLQGSACGRRSFYVKVTPLTAFSKHLYAYYRSC